MTNRTTAHHFLDLEIRIFPSDDRVAAYPIEMIIGGQQHFRGHLSPDVLSWTFTGDPVEDGHQLFQALFASDILRTAWGEARGRSIQRRIRFHIDENSPKLYALPWELLHEGDVTLSASADTPFSRYLAVSMSWGSAVEERPIRVLALISNPADLEDVHRLPPLDVDEERAILEKALSDIAEDAIDLNFLDPPVTLERIQQALQSGSHILHYVGHGAFNERRWQAVLYLQDDQGDTAIVRDTAFIEMLARQSERARPRLIFLAACQTATPSSADAFRGLGPRLVAAGVPAVVAMQDRVAIQTARQLSLAFYRHLAEHGIVDYAMNQARSVLLTTGRPNVAVPVLFMRLKSGQLWEAVQADTFTPRPFEPETVHVPAGPFLMGSPAGEGVPDHETPQYEVTLPAYRIGKYPVTNDQYAEFLKLEQAQEAPSRKAGWFLREPPADKRDHPVVGVSWYDAQAYCHWLSAQTGRRYRLPTEAEWEKAARGAKGWLYPWGDEWEKERCNVGSDDTTPVTAHPQGASPYGCCDVIGNVQEWTSTLWGNDREPFRYPYRDDDGREDLQAGDYLYQVQRVHRGGSFRDEWPRLRCSARSYSNATSHVPWRGFRVVLDV